MTNHHVEPKPNRNTQTSSKYEIDGVLELDVKMGGYIRSPMSGYIALTSDPFVPPQVLRSFRLRGGEQLQTISRPEDRGRGLRRSTIERILSIHGVEATQFEPPTHFEQLTAIDPNVPIRFEIPDGPISSRVIDLFTPIGFGQRGLVAAPPRTGKTILLQQMAAGIAKNHPDAHLIVLLVDERPEEVTHMKRAVKGEVAASSNDHPPENHIRVARLVIERAKRLVEHGKDVVILLDSLTRLGRAFNSQIRGGGRIMSGGLDTRALLEPKAVFGAARNVEHGGSLTIIATALIETGSRMDEVIFNEFKGTGNMEIMLSREMANRRIWPAIDLDASGTRKEELLIPAEKLEIVHRIRRRLAKENPCSAMELLIKTMGNSKDNESYLKSFDQ